jgi:mannobiose 2-epimerase
MTWVAAQVAMRRPDLKNQYLPIVRHGVDYLSNTLWDKQYGGFYWGLDDRGHISPMFADGRKHLYGMSFCLYGLAAAYQATGDPQTLALAQETFRWIDTHAHDARNGGYFELLTREGKVIEAGTDPVLEQNPPAGFPIGYKSMNTHIHLLESFTQLYEVWKDDTLRQRLEELLAITRGNVCVEPGVMNLYFTNEWRAIPDHDSYGHDVETAYLMIEAAEVLGRPHDAQTERMAKMLVDHALAFGWDETYGGFYGEGTTFGRPENTMKDWWVQVEGLNALLLMHEKYGQQNSHYFKAFQQQWNFIKNRQIDSQFGGLYAGVQRNGSPTDYSKAQIWKAAYHDGRALLNVTERLKRMAAD